MGGRQKEPDGGLCREVGLSDSLTAECCRRHMSECRGSVSGRRVAARPAQPLQPPHLLRRQLKPFVLVRRCPQQCAAHHNAGLGSGQGWGGRQADESRRSACRGMQVRAGVAGATPCPLGKECSWHLVGQGPWSNALRLRRRCGWQRIRRALIVQHSVACAQGAARGFGCKSGGRESSGQHEAQGSRQSTRLAVRHNTASDPAGKTGRWSGRQLAAQRSAAPAHAASAGQPSLRGQQTDQQGCEPATHAPEGLPGRYCTCVEIQ